VTNKELISWANKLEVKYGAQIAKILGVPIEDAVFKVGTVAEGKVAETSGTTITLSATYFKDNPTDAGAIVHELVHAYQLVPPGQPSKRIEAFADAVRYKLSQLYPNAGLTYPGWEMNDAAAKLADLSPEEFRTASERLSGKTAAASAGTQAVGVSDTGQLVGLTDQTASELTAQGGASAAGATSTAATTPPGFEWTLNGKVVPAGTAGATLTYTGAGLAGGSKQNAEAAFNTILSGYGLAPNPDLNKLVQKAVAGGWSSTRFALAVQDTPEFHQQFPGIFKQDGTLKMSPAQYLAVQRQFEAIGAQSGIDVGAKRQAWLFRNNVSPAEFQARAQADTTLRTNQAYFNAFNEERKANGLPPLTHADQFKMIMGEGNQEWYDQWQGATTRYAAEQAGLSIKAAGSSYLNINEHLLNKVNQLGLTEDQAQAGFQDIATHLLTTYPLSKLENYNLSKRRIEAAVFGGPGSAQTRELMKHVLAQEQAFTEPRATPEFSPQSKGGSQTIQTEQRPQG
jgi:hypothetical protein